MAENLIIKIAETQVFMPNDDLSHLVEKYSDDEIIEENLDLVCAANKDRVNYNEFVNLIQTRNNKFK